MNTVNISAFSNERLFIPVNLSEWAAVHDLAIAAFWGQVRRVSHRAEIVIDFTKSPGAVTYNATTKLISFSAPQTHVEMLAGDYEWDFGFTLPASGPIRIGGGTFSIDRGTTEHEAA